MAEDIKAKVQQVNDILHKGEPGNISLDDYSGFTGYKPQFVVDAMNEAFGFGAWGFHEIENFIEPGEKLGTGLAISKVKGWLAGIEFQPEAWGQSRVTRGDTGDARKGAQTDAIKKALSYFSIGTRAYRGMLKVVNRQAS